MATTPRCGSASLQRTLLLLLALAAATGAPTPREQDARRSMQDPVLRQADAHGPTGDGGSESNLSYPSPAPYPHAGHDSSHSGGHSGAHRGVHGHPKGSDQPENLRELLLMVLQTGSEFVRCFPNCPGLTLPWRQPRHGVTSAPLNRTGPAAEPVDVSKLPFGGAELLPCWPNCVGLPGPSEPATVGNGMAHSSSSGSRRHGAHLAIPPTAGGSGGNATPEVRPSSSSSPLPDIASLPFGGAELLPCWPNCTGLPGPRAFTAATPAATANETANITSTRLRLDFQPSPSPPPYEPGHYGSPSASDSVTAKLQHVWDRVRDAFRGHLYRT